MKKTPKPSPASRPKTLPLKKKATGQVKGGRRSSVKDAHDKYANTKVEY